MKLLVISPQPFFSPRGTPFSVYYRTLIESELGLSVDLLTYGEGQDVEIENLRIIRIPRFSCLGKVKVGPSLLKMFLDCFLVLWTLVLLIRNRYEIVHAHEEAVFWCCFLQPIFRFRLIYDMHSSLPQQLTNFHFTRSRVLIGIFHWLEKTCLRHADAVITICPDLARYALELVKDRKRHFLIENCVLDPVKLKGSSEAAEHAQGEEEVRRLTAHLAESRKWVVYAGTLEPYQGIDILIDAFPFVLRRVPEAFLIVVGGTDSQVGACRAQAQSRGLEGHCLFAGRVSHHAAKRFNALASVLLSTRTEGTNTPLKVYEQLASGIPVVATRIYSHTQVLTDEVAFLVDPNPKAMAQGICDALLSESERQIRSLRARELYENKYARQVYVEKLRQLILLLREDKISSNP